MTLTDFDVFGDSITNETTEELIKPGDPRRSLTRFGPAGSALFVSTRLNLALLRAAVKLPILLLKPSSRADEVLKPNNPAMEAQGGLDLLTPEGSRRNWQLLARICDEITKVPVPACYLAEQHGANRRDFYFVTEDTKALETVARTTADASSFPLIIEQLSFAEVAPVILPREAVGELGLNLDAPDRVQPTRFEFFGAEVSLEHLRARLERLDYRYISLERGIMQLRMIKTVQIDGSGFLAVLREIVPLARSLGCSYCGTETLDGFDQFALNRPLPDRYAAPSPRKAFRSFFGRKG